MGAIKKLSFYQVFTKTPSETIRDKILFINLNRIFHLSIVSSIMRLLIIVSFLINLDLSNKKTILWKTGILATHLLYLFFTLIILIFSYKYRKKEKTVVGMYVVQYAAAASLLIFSVILVALDQFVTTSIAPFILACVALGSIFLIKPIHCIYIFICGYIVYFFMMGITQVDAAVLLSNRINGLTSIALGAFISFMFWKQSLINIEQENYIKSQKKLLEEKNNELEILATYDSLTELYNRRCFEQNVTNEIIKQKVDYGTTWFLVMDIDNFKEINDEFGHPVGDELLKEFALLLKRQLRKTDIISRIGGDEFAVLLINTTQEDAVIIAEKIRTSVEEGIFTISGRKIKITVSIGISSINEETNTFEEVYKSADMALYNAKLKGKNIVETL